MSGLVEKHHTAKAECLFIILCSQAVLLSNEKFHLHTGQLAVQTAVHCASLQSNGGHRRNRYYHHASM